MRTFSACHCDTFAEQQLNILSNPSFNTMGVGPTTDLPRDSLFILLHPWMQILMMQILTSVRFEKPVRDNNKGTVQITAQVL